MKDHPTKKLPKKQRPTVNLAKQPQFHSSRRGQEKSRKMTKFIFDNLDDELFRTYAFWSAILVVKMLAITQWTSEMRGRKQAFHSIEDTSYKSATLQPKFDDPDVERVRRAHRNDLENILPFFLVALLYLLTGPNPTIAANLIRVAAVARICHSVVYAVYVLPQPARFLSFAAMLLANGYMAASCVLYYCF